MNHTKHSFPNPQGAGLALIAVAFALAASPCYAELYTLTFDGADPFAPNIPYAPGIGLYLSGGAVATAGIELNETEFPPASGNQVYLSGDTGVIEGTFALPARYVAGLFTYALPGDDDRLVFKAYDSSGKLLTSNKSNYHENYVGNLTSPRPDTDINEPIYVFTAGSEIASFRIEGLPVGGGFTLDNLTFEAVPEPAVIWSGLLITAFGMLRVSKGRSDRKP